MKKEEKNKNWFFINFGDANSVTMSSTDKKPIFLVLMHLFFFCIFQLSNANTKCRRIVIVKCFKNVHPKKKEEFPPHNECEKHQVIWIYNVRNSSDIKLLKYNYNRFSCFKGVFFLVDVLPTLRDCALWNLCFPWLFMWRNVVNFEIKSSWAITFSKNWQMKYMLK